MVVTGEIQRLRDFEFIMAAKFWIPMTVAGFFGFTMGYVVGLQIQVNNKKIILLSWKKLSALKSLSGLYSSLKFNNVHKNGGSNFCLHFFFLQNRAFCTIL
jgi:hypothetical protein